MNNPIYITILLIIFISLIGLIIKLNRDKSKVDVVAILSTATDTAANIIYLLTNDINNYHSEDKFTEDLASKVVETFLLQFSLNGIKVNYTKEELIVLVKNAFDLNKDKLKIHEIYTEAKTKNNIDNINTNQAVLLGNVESSKTETILPIVNDTPIEKKSVNIIDNINKFYDE